MTRVPFPFPCYGGAAIKYKDEKVIRLLRKGCANRPFYHISVQEKLAETTDPVIEQIGTYDPLPNSRNEKLVAINFQRLNHYIREGSGITEPVLALLGLSGYFPLHPISFKIAASNRRKIAEKIKELEITAASLDKSNQKSISNKETPEETPPSN